MFIETSSPRSYGDKAKLLFSPPSSIIGIFFCLKFYSHMYGTSINRLNVTLSKILCFSKIASYARNGLFIRKCKNFSVKKQDICFNLVKLGHEHRRTGKFCWGGGGG